MLTRTRFPCVLAFLSRLTVSISFRFPGVEAVSPVSSGFIVSHQKAPRRALVRIAACQSALTDYDAKSVTVDTIHSSIRPDACRSALPG